MERVKRFFLDETATAEAAGTAVMIAAAGLLLAAAISLWYHGLGTAFSNLAGKAQTMGNEPWPLPQ